ncbi:L-2-amino-thiazoline-4-carboxylic acid hydrolase [Hazenella sp. IB182353]|uniref:L-2-amino-thiazoline-4-carboxylic acid hydrolase n=1 Tax=Polycladospora coralii TaxID=2771432 RepID=UPI001746104F|nr:L-2-amino-thiazoline-4-carboxylic acid hydrolase [Polycladospora coralii]MBS7529018.1 L-2-amino-thiazoline-4-carboxylic acid hydrolase [Polycladospora coralii]
MLLEWYMEKALLKGVKNKLGRKTAEVVSREYKNIVTESQHWVVDRPTQFNLVFVAMSLALYRVVRLQETKEAFEDILRYVLYQRTQRKNQKWMRLFLKIDPNPFKRIVLISKSKHDKHYGNKHFTHEVTEDNAHFFIHHVKKCFYYNFFTAHHTPELTAIFCEMDNVWGTLIENHPKVRFSRPQTIAQGDSHCVFIHENLTISKKRA